MKERLLLVPVGVWMAFFALASVLVALPGIDLRLAGLFFTPGEGFAFDDTPLERFVYHSVEWLTLWGNLALVALWVYGRVARSVRWRLSGRQLTCLLLSLAIGPGLIVNGLFKEHWGRARPVQVAQFGGERTFSPAFIPSDQGGGSFSSGHAAAAFYWMAVAALLSGRRRRLWLGLAVSYGVLVGLVRMAAGGHYFSDVVVSFFVVLILTLMLEQLLLRGLASSRPARSEQAVSRLHYEPGAARPGLAVHRGGRQRRRTP